MCAKFRIADGCGTHWILSCVRVSNIRHSSIFISDSGGDFEGGRSICQYRNVPESNETKRRPLFAAVLFDTLLEEILQERKLKNLVIATTSNF